MSINKVTFIVPKEPDYIVMPIMKELKRYRKLAKEAYLLPLFENHGISLFKNRAITFKPSIGVLSLATILNEEGLDVDVLHQDFHEYKGDWKSQLEKAARTSDLIGFNTLTVTYNNAIKAMNYIKKFNREVPVIAGGPHASETPLETLNDGFDYVFIGESEKNLLEFVRLYSDHQSLEKVSGLAFKEGEKVVVNPKRKRMPGNEIPNPDYSLIPKDMLNNISIQIQTSRGCPFSCSFCVESGQFSYKPTEKVLEDLYALKKYTDVESTIWIADSLTGIPKKRTIELAKALHQEFPDAVFFFQTRPKIMDEETYKHLASNNYLGIKFGLESLNDRTLKLMNKGLTFHDYLHELELVKDIFPMKEANLIVGYPGETTKDCHTTLERLDYVLAKDLLQTISCSFFAPYPGSPFYQNPSRQGIKINNPNTDSFITKGFPPNFNSDSLSEFEIYTLLLRTIAIETGHLYRRANLDPRDGFEPERFGKYLGHRS